MRRLLSISLLASLALVACKGDKQRPGGQPASNTATPTPGPPAAARAKPEGSSIAPVVTNSVTFVVPKAAAWWGEFQFSCYRAVMSLTGKGDAGDAFEKISPMVPEAMAAGGIDLGRDMAGMGIFACGEGPCLYVAANLAHPEKMPDVLGKLVPGKQPATIAPGHYTLDTQGVNGTRTIHVRVVPIDWSTAKVPGDAWSQEAAKATHVVFIGGVDGRNADVDPMTLLADAQTAAKNVAEAESVLGGETQGRCMAGLVGEREFQPGYKLTRGRFAMAAPAAKKPDAMMTLLGSKKTLDVEVELVLDPKPTDAQAKQWIDMGRMAMSGIGANVRGQFAGQGDLMDVYFDILALVGEKGFSHAVKGSSLQLSWRTDRLPKADVDSMETRLEGVLAP